MYGFPASCLMFRLIPALSDRYHVIAELICDCLARQDPRAIIKDDAQDELGQHMNAGPAQPSHSMESIPYTFAVSPTAGPLPPVVVFLRSSTGRSRDLGTGSSEAVDLWKGRHGERDI
jgi:hypothetical protein